MGLSSKISRLVNYFKKTFTPADIVFFCIIDPDRFLNGRFTTTKRFLASVRLSVETKALV